MPHRLQTPRALLLDFGGVIADAPSLPDAPPELVRRLYELVAGVVPADRIARDLAAGTRDYATWRDEVSAAERPAELSHAQVWCDFVVPGWPEPAREAVRREATALSYAISWNPEWTVRAGVPEVLAAAAGAGLPVAVVSNTLCGAAHRDFIAGAGLADRFVAQFYSDEAGVRKPNPELAWRAAERVGVPIRDCWFVGDSRVRDMACARRAGAGAAVLMRSPRTDREAADPELAPDVVVEDGYGLLELLP